MDHVTRLLNPAESLDPALEDEIHELIARVANLVSTLPLDYAALGPQHAEALWQFAALGDFLNDRTLTKLLWVPREGELEFTCVEAAPAIGDTLRKFGGAILMSATLQPYDNIAAACGLTGADEPATAAAMNRHLSANPPRLMRPYMHPPLARRRL